MYRLKSYVKVSPQQKSTSMWKKSKLYYHITIMYSNFQDSTNSLYGKVNAKLYLKARKNLNKKNVKLQEKDQR